MTDNVIGSGNMRIFDSEEAVSEVFGYIIILGILIAALGVILIYESPSIQDTKDSGQMSQNEQAFTVLDSRLSKARFSTSIFQEVPFKVTDGTVKVDDTSSKITVTDIEEDLSGNIISTTQLYSENLGTLKSIGKDVEIGYEDGGVWELYPNGGGSIMISPPDFNYNGITLTLPVTLIRSDNTLNGYSSAGYSNSIAVIDAESTGISTIKYPNADKGWANPIATGHYIEVKITSDYANAWKSYFNERVEGAEATIDPGNPRTVIIRLSSGWPLQTGLYSDGFTTSYMETTDTNIPLDEFMFDLFTVNPGNDFWLTYGVKPQGVTTPDPQLLIYMCRHLGNQNKDLADIRIQYQKGSQIEIFEGTVPFHRKVDNEIYIDMLSHDETLTYRADSSPKAITWGSDPSNPDPGIAAGLDNGAEVSIGDTRTLYDVSQHYMWLMAYEDQNNGNLYNGPQYVVYSTHDYSPGNPHPNKKDLEDSKFTLKYKSKQDIKYLYITEGTLKISLGGKSA
ncbi:conserved hypothetical protein [Methanocella paludicola SANAE]|uniref:Uncharacterized protein n=1 Tax=Methanocella paludicola (strain DSM 17711 / JCM 13418 / NBRC 101707 / SANAE) TaxID=304371 RepID=D1YV65_METPS|nr:hypothetical protein [Methanocella paludicola]BAI60337.1 conserved hypothetical protein [Methanocella paludicola SANAE]